VIYPKSNIFLSIVIYRLIKLVLFASRNTYHVFGENLFSNSHAFWSFSRKIIPLKILNQQNAFFFKQTHKSCKGAISKY